MNWFIKGGASALGGSIGVGLVLIYVLEALDSHCNTRDLAMLPEGELAFSGLTADHHDEADGCWPNPLTAPARGLDLGVRHEHALDLTTEAKEFLQHLARAEAQAPV